MKLHPQSSVVIVTGGAPQGKRRGQSAVPRNGAIPLERERRPPSGLRRVSLSLCVSALGLLPGGASSAAEVIWQEAEAFRQTGGWSNDSQHVDLMGSPYLLATGVGHPVADAVTGVKVPRAGRYRLWVRCRDWFPSHSPGTFEVRVGGMPAAVVFGKSADDRWRWCDGGEFELAAGDVELRLRDTSGWWGRCDAVVLADTGFKPADDPQALARQRGQHAGVSPEIADMPASDVVVVGGGPAGLGAALAAARHGARVSFIQDRPVLGGNASSEIQVPPMGYIGNPPDTINVTGIAEEIFPLQGWTAFADSERIGTIVRAEKNISLFLNTRATGVEMSAPGRIGAVLALDVRTGRRMRFAAPLFIDCTGHGWVGFYAGADFRMGTESRSEFGESMAPLEATPHTMGNSLYKAVSEDMGRPDPFVLPDWAFRWEHPSDFEPLKPRIKEVVRPIEFDRTAQGKGRRPKSATDLFLGGAYTWYVETGGMHDTVKDAERIRDELLRIHLGLWNYAKNHDPKTMEFARQRRLTWLNHVPGVRESRRLMGDYIMTQKDFDEPVAHPDTVAFTDWGIDDHHPQGFWVKGIDVMHVYHGRRVSIPYRSLYSRNIANLFMAGRCLSASHLALGGVRVQRPMCATGQAAGTAAALAARHRVTPRDIHAGYIGHLQQLLLKDGCYLVGVPNRDPADLARLANPSAPEVINGWNRESQGLPEGAPWSPSNPVVLEWEQVQRIREVHLSINLLRFAARLGIEVATPSG
nr:FAD-dependent oxidoreductase [Akkermansiaceae bacterium]